MPHHHPSGAGQRARSDQRRRPGGTQAQDRLAGGTTHLVMSPLELMQRLAALVPRPRLHLIRFHGVLAPNAKLRALVVPQEVPQEVPQVPETPAQQAKPAACAASGAGPWPGPARGLRLPNRDSSGDPATRAAGVACLRVVAGPREAARRQGITRRRHHGEANFGWAIDARQIASRSQPASKGGFKRDGRCVSAHAAEFGEPWGGKRAFEKHLSPGCDAAESGLEVRGKRKIGAKIGLDGASEYQIYLTYR